MSAVAIIPARAGSTRIPGKNSRIFHGRPIIEYTIDAAKRTGLFDEIVVSTDGFEIAQIADLAGAVPVCRPWGMCENQVGTQGVVADTIAAHKIEAELICCLYPTSPLMLPSDIERGYRALVANLGKMFAFSVGTEPLQDAAQFYWGRPHAFGRFDLFDEFSVMVPIDAARVCDINVEQDWEKAERMYAKLKQEGKI